MNTSSPKFACQILAIVFAFFICRSSADAQSSIYAYQVYKTAGTSPETAMGIVSDGGTNNYVLGGFSSATTINGTTLNNASGWPNIFLLKFKFGATNAPHWVKALITVYTVFNVGIGTD